MDTIEGNGLRTDGFLMSWFFTLFSRAFNLQVVRAVWDMIFIFGEFTIIQTSIAIFKLIKEDLTMKNLNFGFNMIRRKTNKIMMDVLAKNIVKKQMSDEKFTKMVVSIVLCEEDEDQASAVLDKYFDYQASALRSIKKFKSAIREQAGLINGKIAQKPDERLLKIKNRERLEEDYSDDEEIFWN